MDSILLLSVGELNKNKNHEIVIRALAKIKDKNIHYAIAGKGELHDFLINMADELGIAEQVHLLGFRKNIDKWYQAADLYIHPSLREGFPVALMEAIASKRLVICSRIRGNIDLVSKKELFMSNDVNELVNKIKEYIYKDCLKEIEENYEHLKEYDISIVSRNMKRLYF